jgi:hypothetical protein
MVLGMGHRVAGEAAVRLEHRHAVHGIAERVRPLCVRPLQENAGGAEQQDRHRHLKDDQRVLQRQPPGRDALRTVLAAKHRQQVDLRGGQGWRQAAGDARDHGDANRERQDAHVEREVDGEGQLDRSEPLDGPPRQDAARDPARHGQQDALGQQLPHQLTSGCADGQADRDLLRARRPAHQEQGREVAARDREDESDDDEHDRRGCGDGAINCGWIQTSSDAITLMPRPGSSFG